MKANWRQIDLNEVVGRNEIIKQIWDTIDRQSIRICRAAHRQDNIIRSFAQSRLAVVLFQDLEKCHMAEESLPLYTKKSMAFSRLVKGRPDASELSQSYGRDRGQRRVQAAYV